MVEALTAWRGLILKYVTGGCIVFIQASLPLVVQSNIARRTKTKADNTRCIYSSKELKLPRTKAFRGIRACNADGSKWYIRPHKQSHTGWFNRATPLSPPGWTPFFVWQISKANLKCLYRFRNKQLKETFCGSPVSPQHTFLPFNPDWSYTDCQGRW